MQDHSRQIVDTFLEHRDEISDDIMADAGDMPGVMPFIFPAMRERADTFVFSALADYRTSRPEHLPPRIAELIAIAAAAGAGADNCLKVHIGAAQKEGATRDEILDTVMIAAMIGRTKSLHPPSGSCLPGNPPQSAVVLLKTGFSSSRPRACPGAGGCPPRTARPAYPAFPGKTAAISHAAMLTGARP